MGFGVPQPEDGTIREVLSVSEMVDRLAYLQTMQLLRCAQALRSIRDTCPGTAANIARRALEEAQVPEPEYDGDSYYWDQEVTDG